MNALLQIASRVEAAEKAYISVRGFGDREEWRAKFEEEMTAAIHEVRRIFRENGGACPPLHPILIALSIVLDRDEDLGRITRFHPGRWEHEFYDDSAEFPADLSDLLPPSADCWWEPLVEAARREHAARTPQAPAVQRKVRLLVSAPAAQPEEEEGESLPMELDEDPESRGRPKAAKAAATTRKRKGSLAAPRGTSKHHAQLRQRPEPVEEGSGGSNIEQGSGGLAIQCRRCVDGGHACKVVPNSPCKRCKKQKQGCSLMPRNPSTRKTDRCVLPQEDILEFRIRQMEEMQTAVKKGKRRAHDSPGPGKSDSSWLSPSPLATLSGLGGLTLDSGGSSAAGTPADSPATLLPQPTLPEHPAPAPPSAPKTRHSSSFKHPGKSASVPPMAAPAQHSTDVTAEVPSTSQLLRPAL
ncbi:hypothetical protein V8E52_003275 [Russula decolorans]